MQNSLMDWQRASWLPLLGLGAESAALDLGSGYGAITHSLALAVKQVYSLEAIPQRIEFTRTRLEQEEISNVQLVQANALDPPFHDGMFDLVVVNGVLEWVGEWASHGNPRNVQVQFLKRLGRMLKPNGVLLIGIENRFGYQFVLGLIDHSGVAYTSLMPRSVATWYLRRFLRKHHRTELNLRREYRTYTYSELGYRKLLADSGFNSSLFYWSEPGYNQPYSLVPLLDSLIAEHLNAMLAEPALAFRHGWRRPLKRLAARLGLLRLLTPEFVILARKSRSAWGPEFWHSLRMALPLLPEIHVPAFSLTSCAFGLKNVVRVFESGYRKPRCVLKTATVKEGSEVSLEREYRALLLVNERLTQIPNPSFSTPRPLGSTQIGPFYYTAESVAAGISLSRLAFTATGARRFRIIQRELPRCVRAAAEIAQTYCGNIRVGGVNPAWWQLPEELRLEATLQQQIAELKRESDGGGPSSTWIQHGDFTIENVFVEHATGKLTVVDWEHLLQGGPPLYDLFSLLVSILPAVEVSPKLRRSGVNPWREQFEEAFFGQGHWTAKFREWILLACEVLSVPKPHVLPMFLQSLLFRFHFLKGRGSSLAREHAEFLEVAARRQASFLLRDSNECRLHGVTA